MNSWYKEVKSNLSQKKYQKVADFYEEKIANDSENISLYYYWGLAYLLAEKEAEAKSIWLSIFSQGTPEKIDQWTAELLEILEQEAVNQANNENYQVAWLIRYSILDFNPSLVENLLQLIDLEIILEKYQPVKLKEWGVIDLLKQSQPDSINYNLLEEVLRKVLKFPTFESVDFADATLSYSKDFLNQIVKSGDESAYERQYTIYAVDLNKCCLKYDPDNLLYYKNIFWFYTIIGDQKKALEVAQEFYDKAKTPLLKAFGSYQILYINMLQANWQQVPSLAEQHQKILLEMTQEDPLKIELFLAHSFISLAQPLLYIQDNPRRNRLFLNEIARLFEHSTKKTFKIAKLDPEKVKKREHKKLKIGYIAHTLRRHSVGWLSRWLFQYHDREKFEIIIYLVNKTEDELTRVWFRPKADKLQCFARNTKEIAEQIKKDEIDILVDLDSITLNLTCQVMSFNPAPVQVTWLGLDASGLPCIDYYIADPYVLPHNAQNYYREKIWRLPQTYVAVDGFEIGVPTLKRENLDIPQDAVIFLNFQGALKRHPDNLHLQMKIIKAIPNSYFLTKGTGDQEILKEFVTEVAISEGVSPDRLRFLDRDRDELTHRGNLSIADVVLDTYPYNGATTTLEVLWVGIPIVTRVGEQFAARNSYTFMKNVGLTEGVAWTDEEYVEWGIKLGTDPKLRQQVSWKLKQSRRTSPLWNTKEFTKQMEQAYQKMWENYLEGNS